MSFCSSIRRSWILACPVCLPNSCADRHTRRPFLLWPQWLTTDNMLQEAFEDVMKGYPQAFKAMDLVAEHRLRVLHTSWAFIHQEDPRAGAAAAKEAAQVTPA